MSLIKSRKVLDLRLVHPREGAVFAVDDDDTGAEVVSLTITEAEWREFGMPRRATVTVEPGDLLNHRADCRDGSKCGEPSHCPPMSGGKA